MPYPLRRPLACLAALGLFAAPALPWWETGHRAVARIAAARLTPAARTRIARIVDVPDDPAAIADALARISTWADETKKETGTGNWHFIDLALQDRRSDIPARCPDDNCAPARIHLFAAQLAARPGHPSNSKYSELDALRYLVHLVGDIHQPLHTISDADLGGNCELLDPPVGKAKNLHALWDGEIVEEMNLSDTQLADRIEQSIAEISPHRARRIADGNEDDWVWESHELAERAIYTRLRIPLEPVTFPASCADAPEAITTFHPDITPAYTADARQIIENQLLRAGLRLARLLNESL